MAVKFPLTYLPLLGSMMKFYTGTSCQDGGDSLLAPMAYSTKWSLF